MFSSHRSRRSSFKKKLELFENAAQQDNRSTKRIQAREPLETESEVAQPQEIEIRPRNQEPLPKELPPTPRQLRIEQRNHDTSRRQAISSGDVSGIDVEKRPITRPNAKASRQDASKVTRSTIGARPLDPSTKSAVSYLTRDELARILPDYLDNPDDTQKVIDAWGDYQDPNRKFNSVPQLIEWAFNGQQNGKALAEASKTRVIQRNAAASPDITPGQPTKIIRRGDTREPDKIVQAGGFHGFGGSISIEHARSWVENFWNKLTPGQQGAWLQNWKAETSSGEAEQVVFVATGEEAQKSGFEYQADIPLRLPASGIPTVKPMVVFNGETLEQSSVIAVAGRGEIVFLTGIPSKYIRVKDKSTGQLQRIS